MTKTVSDLVTRTLQRLSILLGGETAAAEDSAVVVAAFNGMVDGWFKNLEPVADETATTLVPLVEGTEYVSDDDFPILARHFEGVSAMLAVSCASTFSAQYTQETAAKALDGQQGIDAAFMPTLITTVDRTLRRLPSTRYWDSV